MRDERLDRLADLLLKYSLKLQPGELFEINGGVPAKPLIKALQKAYTEVTGEEAELLAIGGGTYAKTMPNVVAFGPVFPGQTYKIHEEDECWSVEDIMKNAHIMAKVLVELAERK